jgi:hypothetical protein
MCLVNFEPILMLQGNFDLKFFVGGHTKFKNKHTFVNPVLWYYQINIRHHIHEKRQCND